MAELEAADWLADAYADRVERRPRILVDHRAEEAELMAAASTFAARGFLIACDGGIPADAPVGAWLDELAHRPVPVYPQDAVARLATASTRQGSLSSLSTQPHRDLSQDSWPEMDTAAYHGLAGRFVEEVAPHTEADPKALLFSFLAGVGNIIGAQPHAMVGGAVHSGRLYVVLIGDTSRGRKGQSWSDTNIVLREVDPDWWKHSVRNGLSTGEGLINAISTQPPANGRLFVYEPELSRVLKVARRESNTLSPVIRSAWDDGEMSVMTRNDPLHTSGAHVSILSHITRDELRERLRETEIANGFANRFLFVGVERSKLRPQGGAIPQRTLDVLVPEVKEAVARCVDLNELTRTAAAEELWDCLYREMAESTTGGLLGAVTARAEAQCLRLSVLYAALDGAPEVDVPHLNAAWAAWHYAEESARRCFCDKVGDPSAGKLLKAIRSEGRRGLDTTGQHKVFGRHMTGDDLDIVRGRLEGRGLIETHNESTDGRDRRVSVAIEFLEKKTK